MFDRWLLTVSRGNKHAGGDVRVAEAFGHQADDFQLGGGQALPAPRWPPARSPTPGGVGPRLVEGHRRTLGPGGVEDVVAQRRPSPVDGFGERRQLRRSEGVAELGPGPPGGGEQPGGLGRSRPLGGQAGDQFEGFDHPEPHTGGGQGGHRPVGGVLGRGEVSRRPFDPGQRQLRRASAELSEGGAVGAGRTP